ncbi:hypothetical protein DY000_02031209 [Brassica cretica]|uniref:Uncharacterized protein n=1 Tax=Brassica cretica TaxID=69181 RepID=A0ABQ7DGH1_BRACR|nr:hypothetical protein DY000_02031209 [Brassica cretica]
MDDFLEMEEWLEDMDQNSKKKLDDDQHTSRGDLETSPKASIDRHNLMRSIDNQQISSIYTQTPSSIDTHPRSSIDTHQAVGFHKRVKRIHDPVKIVIPCAVVEVEFPIPPDRFDKGPTEAASIDTDQIPSNDTTDAISNGINKPVSIDTTTSPSIDTGRISEKKEFDVCGNRIDGETTTRSDKSGGKKRRNWKKRKRTNRRFSAIIDPSLLRWCQEIHSAQQMLLTTICKASSTPYC